MALVGVSQALGSVGKSLDSELLVLDGGMGHLLRRKGVEIKGAIGSVERFLGVALANTEQPELVREAHEEYLQAGARVIITNNYACTPSIVGNTERVLDTIKAAGKVAREAADKYGAFVAGSLPPLHESYRPDRVGSQEELEQEYAIIASTIAPYADVLVCETMSSIREAVAAAQAGVAVGKPVWVSWTLSEECDGSLLSGESVEDAVHALQLTQDGPIKACLFNCSLPEAVDAALPRLRAVLPLGVQSGAYANGFCSVKTPGGGNSEYREDLSPERYANICAAWASHGSKILGGCCGVFPEHIEAVALCGLCEPVGLRQQWANL